MMTMRYVFSSLLALGTTVFIGVHTAFAEGFVPIAPIPGLNDTTSATSGSIAAFLNNLYIFSIGAAVILAVGMIIWGGLEYALSEAVTSKTEGRKKIVNALFGLVLVLSPALVFAIINPAILRLDVNFPALQTGWGNWSPDTSTASTFNCSGSTCASDAQGCSDLGRVPNYGCIGAGGKKRESARPLTCQAGERSVITCYDVGVAPVF